MIFHYVILIFVRNSKKGLFHRAISQSGTGHCPWALTRPGFAKKKATKMGELLDCPSKNSKQLLDCLRTRDAVDVIATDRSFQVSAIILSVVNSWKVVC